MAAAPIYCTHKQLKRVYPQIDAFDTKTPIYGWTIGLTDYTDSTMDVYYAHNTGLITDLFWDGAKVDKIAYNTTATDTTAATMSATSTSVAIADQSNFGTGDIVKIDDEYMKVTGVVNGDPDLINLSTPATNRGLFGSTISAHAISSSVYKIIDLSADIPDADSASDSPSWVYDSDLDLCLIVIDSKDPNDYLVEAGEEFTTLVTQFRTDASRYLDSKLDPNLPREQLKDKHGNFDYMIIRSSALIAASFMIRASDPTNEVATALMEEAQGNIDALNTGNAALSWQTTRDASNGIIRDVTYSAGFMRPVDTRGVWNGTFDLIKVKIGAGGMLGTATYNVYVKDGDSLKQSQVVTEEKINGDYQSLAGGLQIRFAGEGDATQAVANNEWEIEVMGAAEHIDASGVKSVQSSRWL